jgi:hypothetical protein
MSYVITGVKRKADYKGTGSNSGNRRQQLKSRAASVDEIDNYGNGAVAVSTYAPVTKSLVDEAGGGVIYVGQAAPGSLLADPVWRIKKLTTVGTVTTTEWAVVVAGDADAGDQLAGFHHIWDGRAGLTYL